MGNSESQLSENNVVEINKSKQPYHNNYHVKQENIVTSNEILKQMNNQINKQYIQKPSLNNQVNQNEIYAKMSPQEYKEFQEYRKSLINNQANQTNQANQSNQVNHVKQQVKTNYDLNSLNTQGQNQGQVINSSPPVAPIYNADVKDKFTAVQNDRLYQQPNAPYHPQPRMDISIQEKASSCNMKDRSFSLTKLI